MLLVHAQNPLVHARPMTSLLALSPAQPHAPEPAVHWLITQAAAGGVLVLPEELEELDELDELDELEPALVLPLEELDELELLLVVEVFPAPSSSSSSSVVLLLLARLSP